MPDANRIESMVYKSKLTRQAAKEKYPEWYEKRIVQKQPKGTWTCKRDLYEWWKRKVMEGGEDGHRFWCIMTLATYAVKCGIPREELEADAMGFIDVLDGRGKRPDNPFTEYDVLKALEAYNDNYITYPIHTITERTGIQITPNRRNGRRQALHLKLARSTQKILNEESGRDWRDGNGRPSKAEIVRKWRKEHPDGRKVDCIRDTGLGKSTVYRHWNAGGDLHN